MTLAVYFDMVRLIHFQNYNYFGFIGLLRLLQGRDYHDDREITLNTSLYAVCQRLISNVECNNY